MIRVGNSDDKNTNISGGADLERVLGGNAEPQQTPDYSTSNGITRNENGIIILTNIVSGNVETHVQEMEKLLSSRNISVLAITQNLDFPLIVYTLNHNGIVYYYPTILTSDAKKGPSLNNFISSLNSGNKDKAILYTPDTKYNEDFDGQRVKAVLKSKYPNVDKTVNMGISVVNYNQNTYVNIAHYAERLLVSGPARVARVDQDKDFTKDGINIRFEHIPEGQIISDTGILTRADFSLSLNIPTVATNGSKNVLNSDYVTVYGYIDLYMVEETEQEIQQQQGYSQAIPVVVTKASPTIVITYIKGASALPGFGMMGIITAMAMARFDMYFGYILDNISKYQDFFSILSNVSLDFNKLTRDERVIYLKKAITAPALALDIPNNGYMEELAFLVDRGTREIKFKEFASRFLKQQFENTMILGDTPLPLAEIFDKKLLDSRCIDVVDIASKSKNKQWVIQLGSLLNNLDPATSQVNIPEIVNLLTEAGLDGHLTGTIARIWLNPEGLSELYAKAGIEANIRALYEETGSGIPGIGRRVGGIGSNYNMHHTQSLQTNSNVRRYYTY